MSKIASNGTRQKYIKIAIIIKVSNTCGAEICNSILKYIIKNFRKILVQAQGVHIICHCKCNRCTGGHIRHIINNRSAYQFEVGRTGNNINRNRCGIHFRIPVATCIGKQYT